MSYTATIQHSLPSDQTGNPSPRTNPVAKNLIKYKATKQAKKVIGALEEVNKAKQNKRSLKSFDDFLDEL